jgi:hypothetical protein
MSTQRSSVGKSQPVSDDVHEPITSVSLSGVCRDMQLVQRDGV